MGNIAEKNGVTNLNAKYLGLEDIRETNGVYSPQRVPSGSLNMSFDPANESTFQTSSTNYNDLQGNVTGTINGSPTYDSKGFFDFDAVNDYIDIENTSSVRTGSYSEVIWLKPSFFGQTGLPASNVNHIVTDGRDTLSGGNSAGGGRLSLRWHGNNSYFFWRFRVAGTGAFNTDIKNDGTDPTYYFDSTKWYMVVIVVTSNTTGESNQVDFYLNDNTDAMNKVKTSTGTTTYNTPKAISNWDLGANIGGTTQFADIELGEAHQYNKLLNSTEITDIWNKTKARYGY